MAGITLTDAETRLAAAQAAHDKILDSQEYAIADRRNRRAMLADVLKTIEFWDRKCRELSTAGGVRVRRGEPISR